MNQKNIYWILLIACELSTLSFGDIIATDDLNRSTIIADAESAFGTSVGPAGLEGVLIIADPRDACRPIKDRPNITGDLGNFTRNWFVLIERGNCDFGVKVHYAQQANYDVAIVYNDHSDELLRMSTATGYDILIPSVFIGQTSANELKRNYLYNRPTHPIVSLFPGSQPFSIKYYLIPFLTVIGTCFVALLLFMFVRYIRMRHHRRRNRLSLQRLKQLPVKQFKKGDEYDVCAICLDDYEEGDKLRILPCQHAYHCKCVDPWLTSSKRVCPLCKRRVLSDDESSNSDTDYDTDDEHAPLLHNSEASSPNAARRATGYSSENPLLRRYPESNASTPTTAGGSSVGYSDASPIRPCLLTGLPSEPVRQELHSSGVSRSSQLVITADISPNQFGVDATGSTGPNSVDMDSEGACFSVSSSTPNHFTLQDDAGTEFREVNESLLHLQEGGLPAVGFETPDMDDTINLADSFQTLTPTSTSPDLYSCVSGSESQPGSYQDIQGFENPAADISYRLTGSQTNDYPPTDPTT